MEPASRTAEHFAAGVEKDYNRADTKEATSPSLKTKESYSENIDGRPMEALDPIEALNDPDWRAKDRKLVRRLDMTFMPLLWILYFHNYLDRNNIA